MITVGSTKAKKGTAFYSMPEMTREELQSLLQGVREIAQRAGAFIQKERETFDYGRVEIKGLNDLVSHVDKGAEALIVEGLRTLLPGAGFIVEENTATDRGDYQWIVDPLDGTTNFVHGIPCYAVSIALACGSEVLLGVVYEASRGECFEAVKDGGAFLNGSAIRVSERKHLSESLIATGFPIYNFERLDNYLSTIRYFMQHTHGLRRIGAASVDLCYVACGRMDAFFEYNLQPWDVAAGALIVSEAGGHCSDFRGGGNWLFGKEMCCSNVYLKEAFQKVVFERMANR